MNNIFYLIQKHREVDSDLNIRCTFTKRPIVVFAPSQKKNQKPKCSTLTFPLFTYLFFPKKVEVN